MDTEAMMKAATPGEAHARLGVFEGTWKATVSFWMGPGDPHVSTGVMRNTWALGNRFMRQDYESDDGMFQGTGYFGFNNMTGRYEGFWIDVMSTAIGTETGDYDDATATWTMIGTADNPAGGTVEKKSVITVTDDDHHAVEMFFETPQGPFKSMAIAYERA